MSQVIESLLNVAGDQLGESAFGANGFASEFGRAIVVEGLQALLSKRNGFFAFDNALHVFPYGLPNSGYDLSNWNSQLSWRQDYGKYADGLLFFAEDVYGEQFATDGELIARFNPETADRVQIAGTINEWVACILNDPELETGSPIAHHWQAQNRPFAANERLIPKMFFVLGGSYETV